MIAEMYYKKIGKADLEEFEKHYLLQLLWIK